MHVPVRGGGGKAKFWVEPAVELVYNRGMNRHTLRIALDLIKERKSEIIAAWEAHLSGQGDRN